MATIRYGVFYKGDLLQSFGTMQEARNFKPGWRYSTLCLAVRAFEVRS